MSVDVTVVIPTRNRWPLLRQALRTVRWQRGVDLEVIVVDDGSTQPVAEQVAGFGDPRLRVARHGRMLGVAAARNRGAAEARGRYVAFLDDDDLWGPDKLVAQLAAMYRRGRAWSVADGVTVDHALNVLRSEVAPEAEDIVADGPRYDTATAGASGLLLRAGLLADVGGFDPELEHVAAWDLWLRLLAHGAPAVVARPLVAYRLHRDAAVLEAALAPGGTLAAMETIAEWHGVSVDRAAVHRRMAWTAARLGERRAALRCYAAAMRARERPPGRPVPKPVGAVEAWSEPGRPRAAPESPPGRRRSRRRLDRAAMAEARRWLDDAVLRDLE